MKIKVCGMKYAENIQALTKLNPDFMGFIFYDRSPRFALTELDVDQTSNMPVHIKKVAVFVDENPEDIIHVCDEYKIDMVQLHGTESVEFCQKLKNAEFEIIKAFGIDDDFDFEKTIPYNEVVDYFLFDTKSQAYGGSGKYFDWALLKDYQLNIPYFLSGGISLENLNAIKKIDDNRLVAIDVNSRFEIKPGLKDIEAVKILINRVRDEF